MADQQITPLALQWERQPDGCFSIAVVAPATLPSGQQVATPLRVWRLSPEEEASLKAALAGLVVAGNGHDALLQSALGG